MANLKKQMKDMEKQIAGNMEDGATDSLADDASEEDGLGGAGGGALPATTAEDPVAEAEVL